MRFGILTMFACFGWLASMPAQARITSVVEYTPGQAQRGALEEITSTSECSDLGYYSSKQSAPLVCAQRPVTSSKKVGENIKCWVCVCPAKFMYENCIGGTKVPCTVKKNGVDFTRYSCE